MAVNVAAPAMLTRAFASTGKDEGGDRLVVNILDAKLAAPNPDFLSYTLSKAALAALTDCLSFPAVKGSTIRNLMMERVDPVLWTLSRDFVGDTAETASLLWPEPPGGPFRMH